MARAFPNNATAWTATFPGVAVPIGLWPLQVSAEDGIGSADLASGNASGDEVFGVSGDPTGRYSVNLEDIQSHLRAATTAVLDQTTGDFSVFFRFCSTGSVSAGRFFARKRKSTATSVGWGLAWVSGGHIRCSFDTDASSVVSADITADFNDGEYHDILAVFDRTNNEMRLYSDLGNANASIAAHAGASVSNDADSAYFGLGDVQGQLNGCAQAKYSYLAFWDEALVQDDYDEIVDLRPTQYGGLLRYTLHRRVSPPPPKVEPVDRVLALGRDLKFQGDYELTHARDYLLVSGDAALRQAIYHCLMTVPGQYKYRPDYGVGLLSYLGKPGTPARIEEMRARTRIGLQRLRRIEAVKQVAVEMLDSHVIKTQLAVKAAGRVVRFDPFLLRRP